MRLSEAIRLGSMMVPEFREGFYNRRGCCALGTAIVAMGVSRDEYLRRLIESHGHGVDAIAPLFPNYPRNLLLHINGRHFNGESRLSIADWLEEWEAEHLDLDSSPRTLPAAMRAQ